jgi:predicted nucleic-acid-binding Zn-ribbon protein
MQEHAKCPKCGTNLKSYDGCLGYEAAYCSKCGYYADYDKEGTDKFYIGLKGREDIYSPRKDGGF